jgi:alpha-L-fucosidase 2
MEANCAVSAGISDLLVQGWGDILRIFPAVPAQWENVAFENLYAEGAFRVSATRLDGVTTWIRVIAGVDRRLRLHDPFSGAPVTTNISFTRDNDLLVVDLASGQEFIAQRTDDARTLVDAVPYIRQQ